MTDFFKNYHQVKIKCTACKKSFDYNAMEGIAEWLKYCLCPKCGALGKLKLMQHNPKPNYQVKFSN